MNNGVAILALEVVVLACGAFYLHQKNPEGFDRVVTDFQALVVSATSSTPPGTALPAAAPETPAVPATPAGPATAATTTTTPPAAVAPAAAPSLAPAPAASVAPPAAPPAASAPPAAAPVSPGPATWTPPAVMPAQPNWTWTTIAGRTYTNVRVLSVDPNSVMIMYDGGGERVPLTYLQPDLQKLFNYTPAPGATPPGSAAAAAALPPSVIGNMMTGNLVRFANNGLQSVDDNAMRPVRYFALYYSAQWCPPCHAFTPRLVQFYNGFKPTHPDFDLIFVSEDHDQNQMQDYMREMAMPWPAITYTQLAHPPGTFKGPGIEAFANDGIPDLVLLDSTGKVLSDSYHGTEYVGPEVVMNDIQTMVK